MYDRLWRGSSPKAEVGLCEFLVFQLVACYFMHWNHCNRMGVWFYSKKPQRDRRLKQHSCQGTQAWSVAMVGE